MKALRITVITSYVAIIAVMAVATVLEKLYGTRFAAVNIYGSVWFTIIWAIVGLSGLAYILRKRLFSNPARFLLHAAFAMILAGALTTHLFGRQGTTHVRIGEQTNIFIDNHNAEICQLPFSIELTDFETVNYPGTQSPMDYVSTLIFKQKVDSTAIKVSLNNIARFSNYRFYQSGYDPDGYGSYLSVSHDPAGIGITYTGYALLFVAMILLLAMPGYGFRTTLKKLTNSKLVVAILFFGLSATTASAQTAITLPDNVAAEFGQLCSYNNGRIAPVQTLARNFTTKLYGKPNYKGFSAEQVLTGWILNPAQWADEPMIKLKGEARSLVGNGHKYVSYNDLIAASGKLDKAMTDIFSGKEVAGAKSFRETDEKLNIIQMLLNGQILKLFPYTTDNQTVWFSSADNLPLEMPNDEWLFVKKSMDYVGELAFTNNYDSLSIVISKIGRHQTKSAAGLLPSATKMKSERLYNSLNLTKMLAMALTTVGILAFAVFTLRLMRRKNVWRGLTITLNTVLGLTLAYTLLCIGLRGYVGGHIPMSNGSETMMFMSACAMVLTLCLQHRFTLVVPFGYIISGLTLMVSSFGESNPQITHLMPVLASPLLSIHVCVLMLAYTLLAFIMLNGIAAIVVGRNNPEQVDTLYVVSKLMLYPALFLLTAGIFIGAIWANQSWGRYWGWDPKEVWALITMLTYAMPLHPSLFPRLQKPMAAHIFLVAAFLSVLITYFGVNFLLGGMHSYA